MNEEGKDEGNAEQAYEKELCSVSYWQYDLVLVVINHGTGDLMMGGAGCLWC